MFEESFEAVQDSFLKTWKERAPVRRIPFATARQCAIDAGGSDIRCLTSYTQHCHSIEEALANLEILKTTQPRLFKPASKRAKNQYCIDAARNTN